MTCCCAARPRLLLTCAACPRLGGGSCRCCPSWRAPGPELRRDDASCPSSCPRAHRARLAPSRSCACSGLLSWETPAIPAEASQGMWEPSTRDGLLLTGVAAALSARYFYQRKWLRPFQARAACRASSWARSWSPQAVGSPDRWMRSSWQAHVRDAAPGAMCRAVPARHRRQPSSWPTQPSAWPSCTQSSTGARRARCAQCCGPDQAPRWVCCAHRVSCARTCCRRSHAQIQALEGADPTGLEASRQQARLATANLAERLKRLSTEPEGRQH